MRQKFGPIFLGIVMAIYGVLTIIKPIQYSSKYSYTWDFTEIKWYFGGFLIVLGGLFIYSALRKEKDDK